jgi:tetrahydromethanopterin S-methyltransferase subunit F
MTKDDPVLTTRASQLSAALGVSFFLGLAIGFLIGWLVF